MAQYRRLEGRLYYTRWLNLGEESSEENSVLDEMDRAWMGLTDGEREDLNREGPHCWPMDPASAVPRLGEMLELVPSLLWTYEGFNSPGDTILSARVTG